MRNGRAIILSDYVGGDGAASGGAGHAALDSFRALRDAGADVRIITGFGELEIAGGFATTLGGHDLRSGGLRDTLRGIYNDEARQRLDRALVDYDPQTTLVIVHQWTRYLSPAALGAIARYPTMIYMHDYFWACPNGAYYDFRVGNPCDRQPMHARCLMADCDKQSRVRKLGRIARQAARIALVRSPAERRLFLHLSDSAARTSLPLLKGERHAIVHNPLEIGAVPDPSASPDYDVGYFGRLEPEKGVGDLADQVCGLGQKGLFVGQGSLEGLLIDRPGIEWRRWQARDTMAAAMRTCRAVVLPSTWNETWGLIVPEAMAAGVPVIVSDRAGAAELVRRFGGGTIFDPGKPGDLRDSLLSIVSQPPPPVAHDELRAFLSFERHAKRIMTLSQRRFDLTLASDHQRPADQAWRRASRSASRLPPPR